MPKSNLDLVHDTRYDRLLWYFTQFTYKPTIRNSLYWCIFCEWVFLFKIFAPISLVIDIQYYILLAHDNSLYDLIQYHCLFSHV